MTDARKTISYLSDIHEVAMYLSRIGARPRSFKDAVVEKSTGKYYKEVAVIKFTEEGAIEAPNEYAPTDGEREVIKTAFANYQFPKPIALEAIADLPDELKHARREDIFFFHNERGQVEMIQQRVDPVVGEKKYEPWTFWSDGKWRKQEHGNLLPLWGTQQLKENSIVFLHEGAKAARTVIEILNNTKEHINFPWVDELKDAAHIGWIGGASNPHRTNWDLLKNKGIKRIYIVADNDLEGKHAVPKISQRINGCEVLTIQFDDNWPDGFDLADKWPKALFSDNGFYSGPSFKALLKPATWATDTITIPSPSGKGRPSVIHKIRQEFAKQWCYVAEVERFICVEFPDLSWKKDQFNAFHASFTKAPDLAKLFHQYYVGHNIKLTYRPDNEFKMTTDGESSALNMFRPSNIKSYKGSDSSAQEFLDFMEYLIPKEEDRIQMLRWIATLIARPQYRIMYGLLLRSEFQGVGKTLLSDHIIAPIIGRHNCAWPNENMIIGQPFNGWLANKRLIVVNEIYAGHNWQAYNRLKTYITDDDIEVNIKHMATYTIPNWSHYIMHSNSIIPLKMDDTDRRILVPEVTEVPWSLEKFTRFRDWLKSSGWSKIITWAHSFEKSGKYTYVRPGEIAPMTISKQQVIEEGRSDVEHRAIQIAEAMGDLFEKGEDVAIAQSDVKQYMLDCFSGKVFEGERKLTNIMKRTGKVYSCEDQLFIKGRKYRFVSNNPEVFTKSDRLEYIAKIRKHPRDLLPDTF